MYDFVYIIDFGNTGKTYYSCRSLNCSPMINYIYKCNTKATNHRKKY